MTKPAPAADQDRERVEEELRRALGTKVSLAKSRRGGRIVIEFSYEKRIPLFWNVSLLIDYKGSSAG